MAKKGYKHKTIAFREDNPEEMKLYNELQMLPYGKFSEQTKEYWRRQVLIYVALRKCRAEEGE